MVELEENLKTINNLKDKIKDLSESSLHIQCRTDA